MGWARLGWGGAGATVRNKRTPGTGGRKQKRHRKDPKRNCAYFIFKEFCVLEEVPTFLGANKYLRDIKKI